MVGRQQVTYVSKKKSILLDRRKNTFPMRTVHHCPQVAQNHYAISIVGGFQDPTVPSAEQAGLTSQLTQLWAGGWTGGLLRDLPTRVITLSYYHEQQEHLVVLYKNEKWQQKASTSWQDETEISEYEKREFFFQGQHNLISRTTAAAQSYVTGQRLPKSSGFDKL